MSVTSSEMPIQPGIFRVIRILRLGRLLRYIECARGVRQLIFTIIKSAPALSNIGTLLFLIMFIYAVIGMSIFGHVKFQGAITPVVNFQTFGSSMCVLFRIATAAGWNNVLNGLMVSTPNCNPTLKVPGGNGVTQGDCGHKLIAIIYLVSFMFIIVQFVIQLYIAVILENFNDAQTKEEMGVTEDDIKEFYRLWKVFDPKAKQFIDYNVLPEFLDKLKKPFRIPKPNYWFIQHAEIPVREGDKCHCLDILQSLIKNVIGENRHASDEMKVAMEDMEAKFKKAFPTCYKAVAITNSGDKYKLESSSCRRIQQVMRWYFVLNNMNSLIQNHKSATPVQIKVLIKRVEKSVHALIKMQYFQRRREEQEEIEEEKRERRRKEKEKREQEYKLEAAETTALLVDDGGDDDDDCDGNGSNDLHGDSDDDKIVETPLL